VSAVNDAPSVTAPASIGVTEDVASAITGISFADVDAAAGNVVATFSVAQGTLAATSGGGVTVGGTATNLTLTGSVADINAFISASSLTYTTVLNDTSAVNLAVSINDGGNTGSGGAQTSPVSNVSLNVNAVNDQPGVTAPATIVVTEDVASAITGISFADVDAATGSTLATFSVAQGSLAATSGGSVVVGGTASNLTLTGSVADINTFISASNLTYTTVLNDTSAVNLAVSINDGGNTGGGGPLSSPVSNVMLNVTAVNDAPTLTTFATTVDTGNEDTEFEIGFVDLAAQGDEADVDGTVDAFVIKSVSTGTLKIGATAGSATLWAAGTNDTVDASNNAYWTPVNHANGTLDAFTAVARDNSGTESSAAVQVQVSVDPVNDTPTGLVGISGIATEDQVLTTSNTLADVDGLGTISYQWQRGGVDIAGATASTYTLTDADVGANITVLANYTDGDGTFESVTSAAVGPVSNINDTPAGLVNITGTPAEAQVLSANTGGVSDGDGLGAFSYQWLRDGVNISGATASTYILVSDDVGADISVQVSFTDGHGTNESVNSVIVGPVAEAALPPIPPTTPDPDPPPTNDPPEEDPAPEPPIEDPVATDPELGGTSNTNGPDAPPSGGVAVPLETLLSDTPSQNPAAAPAPALADTRATSVTRIVAAPTGFDIRSLALQQLDNALDQLTFVVAPTASLPSFGSGVQGIEAPEFVEELDRLREDVEQQTRVAGALMTTNFVATAGLSVGYLFWLLRAEVLLGSFLSSLPAWRLVDPLPVLGRILDEDDDHDDSLETLVERKNRAAQSANKKDMVTQ
jgi:hypothetical protein